jgi:hypothetical protein
MQSETLKQNTQRVNMKANDSHIIVPVIPRHHVYANHGTIKINECDPVKRAILLPSPSR